MSHPKHASSSADILDVIRERWSPRAFDEARDVSAAELTRLFEAARWAPSSFNEQPWRFVIASRRRSPEAFDALLAALIPSNRDWARVAPVLALLAVSPVLQLTGEPNNNAWYDAGQAVAFLTLQATAAGLGIRQMEGFDHARVRIACGVPEPFEPGIVMAIGYPGDPTSLQRESHRAAELRPRSRRPVGEFVFEATWGRTWPVDPKGHVG